MHWHNLLAIAIAILSLSWAHGQEPAQREEIRSYTYKGVGFDSTIEQLKATLPVEYDDSQSSPAEDRHIYKHVPFPPRDHPCLLAVYFDFRGESLHQILLTYSLPPGTKLGDWRKIASRLTDKYGKPSEKSEGRDVKAPRIASYSWNFPDDKRFVHLSVANTNYGNLFAQVGFLNTQNYDHQDREAH